MFGCQVVWTTSAQFTVLKQEKEMLESVESYRDIQVCNVTIEVEKFIL